jgi:hypothetical protein
VRDAARVVQIFVHHAGYRRAGERGRQRLRVGAVAEGEQLHEEPLVRTLRHATLEPALLADVGRLEALSRAGVLRPRRLVGHPISCGRDPLFPHDNTLAFAARTMASSSWSAGTEL